jgi:hypothetical protein
MAEWRARALVALAPARTATKGVVAPICRADQFGNRVRGATVAGHGR